MSEFRLGLGGKRQCEEIDAHPSSTGGDNDFRPINPAPLLPIGRRSPGVSTKPV
jgi:hypothetical protein